MNAQERARQLEVKRQELQAIFAKAETGQVDPNTNAPLYDPNVMTHEMIEEVQKRNAELAQLEDEYQRVRLGEIQQKNIDEQRNLQQIDRRFQPGAGMANPYQGMAAAKRGEGAVRLSDMVLNHVNFKHANNKRNIRIDLEDVDTKTLFTIASGYAPVNARTDKVVLSAQRRPVISDIIPTDPTDNTVIKWMEETTFSSAASTTAEGGLKQESALAFTERSQEVVKIATWLPVTEEILDDIAGMRNLIDNRLSLMVLLAEEDKLLNGAGGGTDILGFLQKSGVQTNAFGTNNADTVYGGFTKVRWTGFAEPSGVIMHPNNWQNIRLMKTSGSGEYILGDPLMDVEARLFGKPVVVTPAISAGTALTGDFVLYSHISRKMGLRVDISDSHSDYFVYNKLAVRAEIRESLEIFRAAAFCKLTGLASG